MTAGIEELSATAQKAVNQRLRDAAGGRTLDKLGLALADGAQINAASVNGETALHLASRWISGGATAWLLDRGADHRLSDDEGNTPLHFSATDNSFPACRALWRHGADLQARNRAGQAPLDVVSHSSALCLFLRAIGAACATLEPSQTNPNYSRVSRLEAAVVFGEADILLAAIDSDPDPSSLPARIQGLMYLAKDTVADLLLSWLAACSARSALALLGSSDASVEDRMRPETPKAS